MADNLNHSNFQGVNELVHLSTHKAGDRDSDYYRIGKSLGDYSSIFRANGCPEEEMTNNLSISGRFNRDTFKELQEALSVDSIRDKLQNSSKQVWEIPFVSNDFEEDDFSSNEAQSEAYDDEDDNDVYGDEEAGEDEQEEMEAEVQEPNDAQKPLEDAGKAEGEQVD